MVYFASFNGLKLQNGFAYVTFLFLLSAISISLAIVSQDEATILMREKERDWLYIGLQYQQAIQSYYKNSPDGIKKLPIRLEDLTLDPRFISPVRHLRKVYLDPLTGKEWNLIRDESGFLIGVYSQSQFQVLLTDHVAMVLNPESLISQHSNVKFIFNPELNEDDENSNEEDEVEDNTDEMESGLSDESN